MTKKLIQITDEQSLAEILSEAYFGKLEADGIEYLNWSQNGEPPHEFWESTVKPFYDLSPDEMARCFDYRDFAHYVQVQTATLQPCKQGLPLS